jgi:hypothetical protein
MRGSVFRLHCCTENRQFVSDTPVSFFCPPVIIPLSTTGEP